MSLKEICRNISHTIYEYLNVLGELSGCHRLPERSFFFRGKQFPVCARCTGAFIGYLSGLLIFPIFKARIWICILFCTVMFADWFIQYKNWKKSNNIRRLITGIICGFGLMQLFLLCIEFLCKILLN